MGDLWTENASLAALYDIECAGRHDHDFYLALAAELGATTVVDIGCGTGVFVVDLADRGHRAIGVDPAAPMLDIARARSGDRDVTWVHGGAADAPSDVADLVVMMGHVAQYFVDDDEWASTLQEIHRVLAPGGHVTFESRNPAIDWRGEWSRGRTTTVYPHPDGGEFTSWVQSVRSSGPDDSYTETHEGHTILPDGRHMVTEETLRFRNRGEIEASLRAAGFEVTSTWGDWDRSRVTDASRELIVLARRP